jgi:uncharacterized protein YeaO (DUF488 family)
VACEIDAAHPAVRKRDRLDRYFPMLAPSRSLVQWLADDPDRLDEFARRYRRELQDQPAPCETLRRLAWDAPLTLTYREGLAGRHGALALQRHLEQLECFRRWDQGWMIGGEVNALRDEIERHGGLWLARHKVWMMPDQASWQRVQARRRYVL